MNFNSQKLAKYLLCNSNIKLPISSSHYVTGKDLSLFSNLICVENQLSNMTCNIKNCCNYFKK